MKKESRKAYYERLILEAEMSEQQGWDCNALEKVYTLAKRKAEVSIFKEAVDTIAIKEEDPSLSTLMESIYKRNGRARE